MQYIAIRCQVCKRSFDRQLDHCPDCRTLSPHGRRNVLLKIISVGVFLASLAFIASAFLH